MLFIARLSAAFLSFQLASSSSVDSPSNLRGSTLALEEEDYNLDDIDNDYGKEYEKEYEDEEKESLDYLELEEKADYEEKDGYDYKSEDPLFSSALKQDEIPLLRSVRNRPALSKPDANMKIELGRFSADDIDIHFDSDSGELLLERRFRLEVSNAAIEKAKASEGNFKVKALNPNEVFNQKKNRKQEISTEAFIPDHLAVRIPGEKDNGKTRHVFGEDERYIFYDTSYPFSTVGRTSTGCTGTMIGPRFILTAYHCIEGAGSITFTPSYYDGVAPFGTANVIESIHWNLVDTSDGFYNDEVAYDYAVSILDRRMGDITGWMGVKNYDDSWNNKAYWSNIGYPAGFAGNQKPTFTSGGAIWTTEDYSCDGLDGKVLGHFIDIEGGHSGGPLYAEFSDGLKIVGVQSSEAHSASYNINGDNQAAGGQAMLDLAWYAWDHYA